MGHLSQARPSCCQVWGTRGSWGSFLPEGWSFLQLHGLGLQVGGTGKELERAKKGREVSGKKGRQGLIAGELIKRFATHNFGYQDVALGSQGGRGSVRGWSLRVPVAT